MISHYFNVLTLGGRRVIAAALVVPLVLSFGTLPAVATSPTQEEIAATCMQGMYAEVSQVPEAQRGTSYTVMVATAQVPLLELAGLQSVACVDDGAVWQQAQRDEICELAYSGNQAVQEQMRRALGVHPTILCFSAEQVAGAWNGEKIQVNSVDAEEPSSEAE